MVTREKYIKPVRSFYDSDLIKIITGVRRCGKSIVLTQILDEIKEKSDNVIFLDFDNRARTYNINSWMDIVEYVYYNRQKSEKCYVFLDEVQNIEDWQLACRSLRTENCSIFVTGSNSKLLSKELTKELSGRYVSFNIRPFIYKELLLYAQELNKNISIIDYLIWGGFPKILEFNTEQDVRTYLFDLNETIVLNDIINRYKIKKDEDFKKFVNYIMISNARKYSALKIANNLKNSGLSISSMTVQKWLDYLKEAYIVDEISKFSKKANREFEHSLKVYDIDVGLNSIRCFDNRYDLTHNLENIVYNELVFMGYKLFVYDNNGKEIDFIAINGNEQYFIQVAYSVQDDKAYEREFEAFKSLTQIDRKILITNDDIDYSTSNVQHIKLKDFLLLENLKSL